MNNNNNYNNNYNDNFNNNNYNNNNNNYNDYESNNYNYNNYQDRQINQKPIQLPSAPKDDLDKDYDLPTFDEIQEYNKNKNVKKEKKVMENAYPNF